MGQCCSQSQQDDINKKNSEINTSIPTKQEQKNQQQKIEKNNLSDDISLLKQLNQRASVLITEQRTQFFEVLEQHPNLMQAIISGDHQKELKQILSQEEIHELKIIADQVFEIKQSKEEVQALTHAKEIKDEKARQQQQTSQNTQIEDTEKQEKSFFDKKNIVCTQDEQPEDNKDDQKKNSQHPEKAHKKSQQQSITKQTSLSKQHSSSQQQPSVVKQPSLNNIGNIQSTCKQTSINKMSSQQSNLISEQEASQNFVDGEENKEERKKEKKKSEKKRAVGFDMEQIDSAVNDNNDKKQKDIKPEIDKKSRASLKSQNSQRSILKKKDTTSIYNGDSKSQKSKKKKVQFDKGVKNQGLLKQKSLRK